MYQKYTVTLVFTTAFNSQVTNTASYKRVVTKIETGLSADNAVLVIRSMQIEQEQGTIILHHAGMTAETE